ncbi:MAG: type II secretion system ATPase GspE [Sedimentisphaerales bacterium]|nr:type II secretion system ATPase GspE [Sedimentisphaerales bacterium]
MKKDLLETEKFDDWLAQDPSPAANIAEDLADEFEQAGLSDLWTPEDADRSDPKKGFEDELCARGHLTAEQLEQARTIHQKTPRKRLGQILLEMNVIKEADLLACLAKQYDLPFIRVEREMIDPKVFKTLEREFIESYNVLPLHVERGRLVVAMTDPANVFLLDEIQRKTKMPLAVKVCPTEDIKNILAMMQETTADFAVDDLIKNIEEDDVEVVDTQEDDISDLERVAGESPIIKFVNYLVFNAVKEGASDIHIEPGDKKLKIRYRIDGILFETMSPPFNMHAPVVSRIKIMANLDIAERRLPQDGRIRVVINKRNVDMRVSTLPTSHGEKVVIRILDTGTVRLNLTDLGMDADALAIMAHQIKQPHGIILVTGPTGSGKSTTLYAALRTMDANRLNISTVEDPVEYQLDGISQVQVHDRIGMSFSSALRSLLRQDPDVIMVGEIRDEETARIAIQASLTGHLVFSTLHTNDAPSSITRLINIGVEPYLIAASTNAVMAQRLVRRICGHCKQPYAPPPEEAQYLELFGFSAESLTRGAGCERCRFTGFQGRVGLYELLVVDDTYRDIITKSPNVTELRRLCKERGMVTLREDGFRKVQTGRTTIDEVMRVTECTV